jgi:hypothetical protein
VTLPQLFAGSGLLLVAVAMLAWVGTPLRVVDEAVVADRSVHGECGSQSQAERVSPRA